MLAPKSILAAFVCLLLLSVAPKSAHAQYKNKAFGFDVAYQLIMPPSLTNGDGEVLAPGDRGSRLHNGIKLGGEGGFKLHHDRWWFNARIDLSFLGFGRPQGETLEAQADLAASKNLGLNMGVDGQVGVRYYFMTDHFRPYLQVALGYLHIFSFGANASAPCYEDICQLYGAGSSTYADNFMPRNNFLTVHVSPSAEIIVRRDLGLHLILDYQRWVTFRGRGNNVFTFGAGLTFYG